MTFSVTRDPESVVMSPVIVATDYELNLYTGFHLRSYQLYLN